MRIRSTITHAFLAVVTVLALAGGAAADVVHQFNKAPYEGTILGVSAKGLLLKWKVSNSNKSFPIKEIQKLSVDGQADFNGAEDLFLQKDYKKAVSSYERAKLRARKPWLKEYINARLIVCFGQTDQLARAVRTYIELCQSSSAMLPGVALPPIMPKGSADNDTALKAVESVLAANPKIANADKLKELRLNIRLVQGNPSEVLGEIENLLGSPNPELRSQMRLKHIELLIEIGKIAEAKASLKVATAGIAGKVDPLDARFEPRLLFYEAQIKYTEKDYLHAAMVFMRVPIHYSRSEKRLAAESLVWAAKAMQESGQVSPVEIAAPLKEAIQKFPDTDGAAKAEAMLKQL